MTSSVCLFMGGVRRGETERWDEGRGRQSSVEKDKRRRRERWKNETGRIHKARVSKCNPLCLLGLFSPPCVRWIIKHSQFELSGCLLSERSCLVYRSAFQLSTASICVLSFNVNRYNQTAQLQRVSSCRISYHTDMFLSGFTHFGS